MEHAEDKPQTSAQGDAGGSPPRMGAEQLQALADILGGRRGPQPQSRAWEETVRPISGPQNGSAAGADAAGAPRVPGASLAQRFRIVDILEPGARGLDRFECTLESGHGRVAIEVVPQELAQRAEGGEQELETRLAQLIERQRAFPKGSLGPLREVVRDSSGDLLLISAPRQGESLHTFLARNAALCPAHALEITRQVLETLSQGHRRGLPHGDLNGENVVLLARVPRTNDNPFGVGVRLYDFGLSAALRLPGQEAKGVQDDLRSVGSMLIALLTDENFDPDHALATAKLPAALDAKTRRLVEGALGWDRARPYQDADDMLRALESSPDWRVRESTVGRSGGWWVAGALLLALLFSLWRPYGAKNARGAAPSGSESPVIAGAGSVAVSPKLLAERERELAVAQEENERLIQRMGQLERDNARLAILAEALRAERDALSLRSETEVLAETDSTPVGGGPDARFSESSGPPSGLLGAALEAPLALQPEAVFRLARTTSPAQLASAAAAFKASALPLLLEDDGRSLNRSRLGAIPALAAWGSLAKELLPDETLVRLDLARQYLDPVRPMGLPSDQDVARMRGPVDSVDPQEAHPWRLRLALAMEVESAPGGLWGPPEKRTLWVTRSAKGELGWSLQTNHIVRGPNPADTADSVLRTWEVETADFDADGQRTGTTTRRILQEGRRFLEFEGDTLIQRLDLAAGRLEFKALFRPLTLESERDVPTNPLGISPEDLQALSDSLRLQTALLHIQPQLERRLDADRTAPATRSWLVPGLGLVRQVDPDGNERELAFVERP